MRRQGPDEAPNTTAHHPSVAALLKAQGGDDPEIAIRERARALIDEVRSFLVWEGPPFDMEALASYRGYSVKTVSGFSTRQDALITPGVIAVNEQKPPRRRRYSVAHEIVHTLFPDYEDELRRAGSFGRDESRATAARIDPREAELERLCQLGAAELLMPRFAFEPELRARGLSLPTILALSELFDTSVEASARRGVELSTTPAIAVFIEPKARTPYADVSTHDYSPYAELRIASSSRSPAAGAFSFPRESVVPSKSVVYKAWKRAPHPRVACDYYEADEVWQLEFTTDIRLRCSTLVLPRRSRTPYQVLALLELG